MFSEYSSIFHSILPAMNFFQEVRFSKCHLFPKGPYGSNRALLGEFFFEKRRTTQFRHYRRFIPRLSKNSEWMRLKVRNFGLRVEQHSNKQNLKKWNQGNKQRKSDGPEIKSKFFPKFYKYSCVIWRFAMSWIRMVMSATSAIRNTDNWSRSHNHFNYEDRIFHRGKLYNLSFIRHQRFVFMTVAPHLVQEAQRLAELFPHVVWLFVNNVPLGITGCHQIIKKWASLMFCLISII